MQAWYFDRLGAGLDGLALGERAEPRPGPGKVVISGD